MKIRLKLYATLQGYLPDDAVANQAEIDVPSSSTPHDIARAFHLPSKLTHLVLVNGHYIQPEQRDKYRLTEGDVLAIWPPIAGG